MYRSGPPFFLYTATFVHQAVPHISISTYHKSGINISNISIFQYSFITTTTTSVLAPPQHCYFLIFKRASPVQRCAALHSRCSRACCPWPTFAIPLCSRPFVGACVWQDHLGNVLGKCLPLPATGFHVKDRARLLTTNSFWPSTSIVLFLLVFTNVS